MELGIRSKFTVEYLKGCSRNTSFTPPHWVVVIYHHWHLLHNNPSFLFFLAPIPTFSSSLCLLCHPPLPRVAHATAPPLPLQVCTAQTPLDCPARRCSTAAPTMALVKGDLNCWWWDCGHKFLDVLVGGLVERGVLTLTNNHFQASTWSENHVSLYFFTLILIQ